MNNDAIRQHRRDQSSTLLRAAVSASGTAAHLHSSRLIQGSRHGNGVALTDLADAAHYLCLLHGRHPGVIDHAATRIADNAARSWLVQTADAFAAERSFLTQVTVAVGPLPSTAGQAECEATVNQQRHALDMLAQSDRRGCAVGAAIALVMDWAALRKVLDAAALRVGIEPKPCFLPDAASSMAVADAIADSDGTSRALQFGADQLLSQHRGLWDLLQARATVRATH